MTQPGKSKPPTRRKEPKKAPVQALESKVSEASAARNAAEKQGMVLHSEFQTVTKRAAALEAQIGDIDEQLKKAREELGKAQASLGASETRASRVAPLEQEVAALRPQLDEARRRVKESQTELRKIRQDHDRLKENLEKTETRAGEHERKALELSAYALRAAALEQEALDLRTRLEEAKAELKRTQEAQAADLASQARQADDARRLAEQAGKAGEDSRRELDEAKRQTTELRTKLEAAQAELKKLQDAQASDRGAQLRQIEDLRRQVEQAAKAGEDSRRELDEAKRQAASLRSRLDDAEAGLRKAQEAHAADRDAQARQVEELRRKAEESSKAGSDATRQIQELQAQLATLQQARERAEAESAGLRTKVEDLKKQLEEADARTADARRYFDSLEQELIAARESEAQAAGSMAQAALREKEAAAQATLRGEAEQRLRQEVARLEGLRAEQQKSLDSLGKKVVDLERRLVEAELRKTEPSEPIAPSVVTIGADAVPPPQAVPSVSSTETTLKPQNVFGPIGADGQGIYILDAILSRDALGVVYRATERETGRRFRVQFMSGQAGEEQTQAMERGMEKLVALPHPNILHVQGTGRRKNRLYVMMDDIDAPTLGQERIRDIPRICAIVRDAAGALHYAHEEGIFHGDVNPEKILVAKVDGREQGLVKDFGLGFMQDIMIPGGPGKDAPQAFRNPAYLPPEQVRVVKSPLTPSVDIYSLGATLYAVLAGRPPFEGKDAVQVSKRVMIEEPLPVEKVRPDVPEAVGAIVRRAMAKERGLRFPTAQEMAEALGRFVDGTR
ncbi:MAG TPA: protein kinase [Planctomycetota bacterium]|nr:protein kinase [Planctomycetota bacterium]